MCVVQQIKVRERNPHNTRERRHIISSRHQHTLRACFCCELGLPTVSSINHTYYLHKLNMRIRKRLPLSSNYNNSDLSEAAPPSDQPSNPLKHPSMPLHTKDQQEEFGDEALKSMETNNDIRKIVTSLHPPSTSSVQEVEYKVVPLKKRKGRFDDEGGCSRVNGRGWRCCQPTLVGYSLCQHHLGKRRPTRGGGDSDDKPVVNANKRKKVGVVKARSMSSLLSQIN